MSGVGLVALGVALIVAGVVGGFVLASNDRMRARHARRRISISVPTLDEDGIVITPGGYYRVGTGFVPTDPDACGMCEQSGQCPSCDGSGDDENWDPPIACEPCAGSGNCPACEGEGTMRPQR